MRLEGGYIVAKAIVLPWISLWCRAHIEGSENLPKEGPVIVAANHVSLFDPLAVAYAIDRRGRRARFLAKADLFRVPFVSWILKSARQVRVERGTLAAPWSLEHAKDALDAGEVIVIFPEGTISRSPGLEPLEPKTGLARLALATGVPVVPCATWGGQWIWGYHLGFHPGKGKDVWVRFGEPLHFEREGEEPDRASMKQVGAKVMEEIAVLKASMQVAQPWIPAPVPTKRSRRKR